jgi:hypothetical protein
MAKLRKAAKERKRTTDFGKCTVCGAMLRYTAERVSRRYCSNACRQWAYRRRT